MRAGVLPAVLALVLSACSLWASTSLALDGSWELDEGTVDGRPLEAPAGSRITLVATGDEVRGTSACNSYGGRIGADGTIGELGGTAMGCEPAVMDAEQVYLDALIRVRSADQDGDVLVLSGPGVQLRFSPTGDAPIDDLAGIEWTLVELVEAETTRASEGDPARLHLDPGGTVTGSTGCRWLAGRWVENGDEILFPDFRADGECPPALQDQDNLVVSVLGDGFQAEIEGDRLVLTSRGDEGLVYERR